MRLSLAAHPPTACSPLHLQGSSAEAVYKLGTVHPSDGPPVPVIGCSFKAVSLADYPDRIPGAVRETIRRFTGVGPAPATERPLELQTSAVASRGDEEDTLWAHLTALDLQQGLPSDGSSEQGIVFKDKVRYHNGGSAVSRLLSFCGD